MFIGEIKPKTRAVGETELKSVKIEIKVIIIANTKHKSKKNFKDTINVKTLIRFKSSIGLARKSRENSEFP